MTTRAIRLLFALLAVLTPPSAVAQGYPTGPVRIVVPFSAGGLTDIMARIIGEALSRDLGAPVLIENRPGAGTAVGAAAVAAAAPDGQTLLLGTTSTFVTNPLLSAQLSYKVTDLTPVTLAALTPFLLLVPRNSAASSTQDLIDHDKARPNALNCGTVGVGTSGHLACELFRLSTGMTFVPVHYRGSAPALIDLIAGRIELFFDSPTMVDRINAGELKALAITADSRLPSLPGVPTFVEAGIPAMKAANTWYGFAVPVATPRPIVERLNAAINQVLADPGIAERIRKAGAEPVGRTSTDEFSRMLAAETERWRTVIKQAGISLN
jgi:tripartite-type tricarboxylate transporter receptor subunit TctC